MSNASSAGTARATIIPLMVAVAGQHKLFFRVPADDAACFPRARNVSVIVRGSGAYSHVTVDSKSGAASSDVTSAAPDWRLACTASEYSDTNLNANSFAMHCEF